ncbi:MAG: transposase [Chloroflexota bacterium]
MSRSFGDPIWESTQIDLPSRILRLKGYDYAQSGAYFVTVCIQNQVCLLGEVVDGRIHPNDAGLMIDDWWTKLPDKFPKIEIDASVVMPNHFHGIVMLSENWAAKTTSLPDIMKWFKTMTTNHYIRAVKQQDWESFDGQFWQRSYHDHIIRNEPDLNRIREYIENNPARWEADVNYSQRLK